MDPLAFLAKKLIILYSPLLKSLKTGLITGKSIALFLRTEKYSTDAKLTIAFDLLSLEI